jgi:lipopolysaccharide/colanic/teichoic acid biosynthesis glycosyltransferase
VAVQPLSIDTLAFELERFQAPPPSWLCIAAAERVCAGALLVVLSPLLIFVVITTLLLSRRSPLIAHRRIGKAGRPIWVLKFRTMWDRHSPQRRLLTVIERLTPEYAQVTDIKNPNDPRVTSRFAVVCRKYSIDELPQLWHIVRGDMAFVGPRPLTATEIETYYRSAARQLLSIKPGLSGLWQVKGRSRLSYAQRRRLDLFMVRKWSLGLYIRILLATVPTVLAGKDAW